MGPDEIWERDEIIRKAKLRALSDYIYQLEISRLRDASGTRQSIDKTAEREIEDITCRFVREYDMDYDKAEKLAVECKQLNDRFKNAT